MYIRPASDFKVGAKGTYDKYNSAMTRTIATIKGTVIAAKEGRNFIYYTVQDEEGKKHLLKY